MHEEFLPLEVPDDAGFVDNHGDVSDTFVPTKRKRSNPSLALALTRVGSLFF